MSFFNVKKPVEIDPFEVHFKSECIELNISENGQIFKMMTHIELLKTYDNVPRGVYEFNSNGVLTLDGDFIRNLHLNNKFKSSVRRGEILILQHQPTFQGRLDNGTIIDNRNGIKE